MAHTFLAYFLAVLLPPLSIAAVLRYVEPPVAVALALLAGTATLLGTLAGLLIRRRRRQDRARRLGRDDRAATAVLGFLLMFGVMMSMVPAAMQMANEGTALAEARADATRAERERTELAAFCARNPQIQEPECPHNGPLPGYHCERTPADLWLCGPKNMTRDPVSVVP